MIHIVLFEPEIPGNTGNIMRTCVATGTKLHLIEPLGFSLKDKYMKRSGLDYIKDLEMEVHDSFSSFKNNNKGSYFFLTRYGKQCYSDVNYQGIEEDIYLIFGKESTGIDKKLLAENLDKCYRIPTLDKVRSLNLANSVNIVLYEVLRQLDFLNLEKCEPESLKGKNFLDRFI